MPFEKGNKLSKGKGRPKGSTVVAELRGIAKQDFYTAACKVMKMTRTEFFRYSKRNDLAIHELATIKIISKMCAGDVKAWSAFYDRLFGKPGIDPDDGAETAIQIIVDKLSNDV
jgi:hypothetical protein